jgi:CRP/FNR family transcriptional regulator
MQTKEDALPIFSKLSKDDEVELRKVSQKKKYSKGELIFSKGEPGTAVWAVEDGRVHLQNVSFDGKVITTCVLTKGDIFCCLPALDGKPYTADALVIEPSVILKIPGNFFRDLLGKNPAFAREIMCTFCDRLRQVEGQACHALDPAKFRMTRVLLSLGDKFKNEIPLTRQEMAEIAGVTVETAIRILSEMKKKKIIRSSRKKTFLIAPEKLRELVEE